MKIKIVNLSLTDRGDKLKVCVGSIKNCLEIKYSTGSYDESKEREFIKKRVTGHTCNLRRSLDPDGCGYFVWIEENQPVQDQLVTLVHELIHVKQQIEDRLNFKIRGESWPRELEAYFVGDLFKEIKDIILF